MSRTPLSSIAARSVVCFHTCSLIFSLLGYVFSNSLPTKRDSAVAVGVRLSVVDDSVRDDIVCPFIEIQLGEPRGGAAGVLKPARAPLPFVTQNGLAGGRVEDACEGSFELVAVGRSQRHLPVIDFHFRTHRFDRGLAVQAEVTEVSRRSRSVGDEMALICCKRAVLHQMEGPRPYRCQRRHDDEARESERHQADAAPE